MLSPGPTRSHFNRLTRFAYQSRVPAALEAPTKAATSLPQLSRCAFNYCESGRTALTTALAIAKTKR
jgi:hypothetical protein